MLRSVSLALALAFAILRQPTTSPAAPPTAEFPPQDFSLAFAVAQGDAKALAARRLAERPDAVDTVRALARAQDAAGLLRSMRLIVDRHPDRIADAAEAMRETSIAWRGDDEVARGHQATLRQIIADARTKLPSLPREEAARADRVFIMLDGEVSGNRRGEWNARLARYIEQYRGTESALLAEVDLIGAGGVSRAMFEALDAFIAQHPGTTAAAKALYQKGFQWHTINTLGRLEPRDADPTPRFLRVLEIVQELQSGRYPASEWVARAPSLIVGFFIPDRVKIASENIDLLIEKFQAAARANFVLSENFAPDRDGIGYLVTTKIGDLYARKGDRVAGVEGTLAALERDLDDPSGVRLLRALFYLRTEREETPEARTARLERARRALRSLSDEGRSLNHRRALATLAALEFEEGQYAAAQPLFARYASAFPESPWAWVARLRVGQCQEGQGHVAEAARTYLESAREHAGMPMARVLGNAYAARAFEATGAFDEALAAHTRALDAWDNAYGLTYSTYVRRSVTPDDPFVTPLDEGLVRKDQLQPRIAQLTRSLRVAGGPLLERGRALLARKHYGEAAQAFDELLARHPSSALEDEARGLKHLARVEEALAAADVHQPTPNAERALKILEALENEPHDFAITAATIMRATLLLTGGKPTDARAVLGKALAEWHERQPLKEPATALELDVAQIRRAIFLPQGGQVYARGRWNAFAWPASLPPYLVVNADVRVKTHEGESTTVSVSERLPLAGKVLFLDTDQLALLQRMIVTLGGTQRREPRQIMETPNQPVGDSMQILGLWKEFFPARPGHWGGWELETYPVITEIEFRDPERTKASAKVTIGYSGATVELEKTGGTWIARRLTSQWIT